jgi:hypothetical protein
MKVAPPIVVDLGRARPAKIRQFGTGAGQLADDVEEVMRLVRLDLGPADANRVFVPVVAVYTRVDAGRDEDEDSD